mmetsp:Transcript_55325/g.120592  ORF Transcript_55325/g.120592 Transcript_55325/m.120592 type:complete len:261 (-) Transcript_55325:306-1088(-)
MRIRDVHVLEERVGVLPGHLLNAVLIPKGRRLDEERAHLLLVLAHHRGRLGENVGGRGLQPRVGRAGLLALRPRLAGDLPAAAEAILAVGLAAPRGRGHPLGYDAPLGHDAQVLPSGLLSLPDLLVVQVVVGRLGAACRLVAHPGLGHELLQLQDSAPVHVDQPEDLALLHAGERLDVQAHQAQAAGKLHEAHLAVAVEVQQLEDLLDAAGLEHHGLDERRGALRRHAHHEALVQVNLHLKPVGRERAGTRLELRARLVG